MKKKLISGAVSRQYHLAVVEKKNAEIARLQVENDELDEQCTKRILEIYKLQAEREEMREARRKSYKKIRAALEPFAIIGRTIPVSWRGDVPYKNQTSDAHSAKPALVDDYRQAAAALAEKE